jgi:hypothetical protein
MNYRTTDYTHKTGLSAATRDLVNFGDLWVSPTATPRQPAPCLTPGSFLHILDNKFYFLKTPAYYGILYGGPSLPDWINFARAEVKDGSARLVGFNSMGYQGKERKATKAGGISAVFVPGCGPTLLSCNNEVWYANGVWGRTKTALAPDNGPGVDPTLLCSGFTQPSTTFNADSRIFRRHDQFLEAPLAVDRTIQFQDDRLTVTVDLTATGDLDLAELYECVPYFADNRTVRSFDAALNEGPVLPVLGPKGDGKDVSLDPVSFRAVDLAGASGAGSTILFEHAGSFKQVPPIRYREDVGAYTRSFNLPLPASMKAGQTFRVRYVIYSHAAAVTPGDLRRVAAECGMGVP